MNKNACRSSGIELLRILVMLQIIFLHLYKHGDYSEVVSSLGSIDYYLSRLIWTFSIYPVNVFIIVTGYFMVNKEMNLKENYRRIPTLYFEVLFYSVIISLIFWISKPSLFSDTGVALRSFFPILSRSWYFITLYIIVLFLSPFLNKALIQLDKKQYGILVLICFFIFSIWPTLSLLEPVNFVIGIKKVIATEKGMSLYSFIFMYILGGYIRRFSQQPTKPKLKYLMLFILISFVNFGLFFITKKTGGGYPTLFGNYDNPIVIIQAVSIFMFFRGFQFKSKFINIIASTTLSVYLIHEQPYMRKWLWSVAGTGDTEFYKNNYYIFKIFLIILLIFIICSIFDLFRQYLFSQVIKFMRIVINRKKLFKNT